MSELREKTTVQTRGANLADVQDNVNKSFAATEKMRPQEDKFFDDQANMDQYTDVGKIKSQKHSEHELPDGLDLFDDEVI